MTSDAVAAAPLKDGRCSRDRLRQPEASDILLVGFTQEINGRLAQPAPLFPRFSASFGHRAHPNLRVIDPPS